jgi:cyclic pyranopterin phosphate synthase
MAGNSHASRVWKGVEVSQHQAKSTGSNSDIRLQDNYNRPINYLRLSVTDRCNLRCRYCRPEKGVPFVPHGEILSFEELERLTAIFCSLGIMKVRVTGGEPFARKGCLPFLQRLRRIEGLDSLHITTNGVETGRYLDALADLEINGINLSLDTLEQSRFQLITRRDYFADVMHTLLKIIELRIPLKINSVVLADTSDAEIVGLAGLARKYPVSLRFIERMPFSGASRPEKLVNGHLMQRLQRIFPNMQECTPGLPATARIFTLSGYRGTLGIIQGHSRLFCKTCNKVRITPVGMLKTCLYDNGVLDLKGLLRGGASDRELQQAIRACVLNRHANGHEAEWVSIKEVEPSMATIGG